MKGLIITLILFATILISCNPNELENPDSDIVYFLVAEYDAPTKGDSYILPLSKAEDIQIAQQIITDPESVVGRLVVARITRQEDNIVFKNKDLLQNRTWSWQVSEFLGFAGTPLKFSMETPLW